MMIAAVFCDAGDRQPGSGQAAEGFGPGRAVEHAGELVRIHVRLHGRRSEDGAHLKEMADADAGEQITVRLPK